VIEGNGGKVNDKRLNEKVREIKREE